MMPWVSPEQDLDDAERALQRAYLRKVGYRELSAARQRYRAAVRRWVDHVHDRVHGGFTNGRGRGTS